MQRVVNPPNNLFVNGNPAEGTPGTIVTAEWLNAVQEELANIIEMFGGELDPEDNAQIVKRMLHKDWVDVRGYGDSISTALGVIGEARATLYVPSGISLSEDTTIPANVGLKIQYPGSITLGDYDLTINGPFEAGLHRVFVCDGSGRVTFSNNSTAAAYPQWWGAVADGVTDDGAAVKLWWESGAKVLKACGNYVLHNPKPFVHTVNESFFLDAAGAFFTVSGSSSFYLFRVLVNDGVNVNKVTIKNIACDCNDLIGRPIEVLGDGKAGLIKITGCSLHNVCGPATTQDPHFICIQVLADSLQIYNNQCCSVKPNPSSTGQVPAGIVATKVSSICHIFSNRIEGVYGYSDTANEGNGIDVFSINRLTTPSEVQEVNVRIFNNTIIDCQGRFIKMQSPGKIYGNDLRSKTLPLRTTFRAIDAQFGGVDVYDNEWRIYSGVTVGAESVYFLYSAKGDSGSEERVGSFCRNKLYAGAAIRFMVTIVPEDNANKHRIDIADNIVDSDLAQPLNGGLAFLTVAQVTDMGTLSLIDLNIARNRFIASAAPVLQLGTNFNNPLVNTWLKLTVIDNEPLNAASNYYAVKGASGESYYVGDVLVANNMPANASGGSAYGGRLDATGIDVYKLRAGNNFFYGTDGGSNLVGSLPSGYTTWCHVQIDAHIIRLTKNNCSAMAICPRTGSQWYVYTGTAA